MKNYLKIILRGPLAFLQRLMQRCMQCAMQRAIYEDETSK